jgi:hypothetical protein
MLAVLKSRRNNSKFIVATQSSFTADDIIIKTGLPVMNLGGFYGTDPVLTFDEFKDKIEKERYKLILKNFRTQSWKNFQKPTRLLFLNTLDRKKMFRRLMCIPMRRLLDGCLMNTIGLLVDLFQGHLLENQLRKEEVREEKFLLHMADLLFWNSI